MCCDNLPDNGHVTQSAVLGTARLSNPELADWIAANVAFPNAMVDRITLATVPRERAMAACFGLGDDPVLMTCEPFRQWVIDDNFPAGRPALEQVADTERRLCLDGSNRQPKFIVPSVVDALAAGGSIDGLALESALWCRYCYGTTYDGTTIAPNDPNWDQLVTISKKARENPQAWLDQRAIYGAVGHNPRLQARFAHWLRRLWDHGTAPTLQVYLNRSSRFGQFSRRMI